MNHLKEGKIAIENSVKMLVDVNMHLVNTGLDRYSDGLEMAMGLKDIEL